MPRLHFSFRGRTRPVLAMRLAAASALVLLASSFLIPVASAGQFTRPRSKAQTVQKFTPISLPLSNLTSASFNTQNGNSTPMVGSFNLRDVYGAGSVAANGAAFWLNQIAREGTVTVYRVEGMKNTRLLITDGGLVDIKLVDTDLFLNFGDKDRALTFFQRRLNQNVDGLQLKSFEVPENFLQTLKDGAVSEAEHGLFPDRPFIVDATKAADQFGIPPQQVAALKENIIQGSGRDLTPTSLPEVTLEVENPGLIAKIGTWIKATFPEAAKFAEKFLGGAGEILGKLGPLFAVAGLIFGLLEMGYSGQKLLNLMQHDGVLGSLEAREGQIDLLHVLSGFFNAVSGGAFVLGAGIAATGIGLPAAAVVESVAVTSMVLGALFTGGALVLENLDAIKAAAKKTWAAMQDDAAKAYAAVANSAQAAADWTKKTAGNFVDATQSALTKAGQWVDEKARQTWETAQAAAKTTLVASLEVVSDVSAAVTPIIKTGTRMVEKEIEQVREVIDKVTMTGERLVEKMMDVVKQVPHTIYETATRIVDKVVPVVRQVTDYVTTKVEEAYQYTTREVRDVVETVMRDVQEAYQVVRQVPRQVTEFIAETVAETKQVARTVYDAVKHVSVWFEDKVSTVWDTIGQWKTRLVETYENVSHWVADRYRTVMESFWGQTGERVSYQDVPVYGYVKETSGNWFWSGWKWIWNTVTNWVYKIISYTRQRIVEPIYNWITRSYQQLVEAGHWVVNKIQKFVSETYWDVQRVSRTVVEKIRHVDEWIENVPRTVYDTVTNWVTRTVPVVKTVYDTVVDTAYRWIQKPVQVIKQVAETVWHTGTRLVDKVVPVVRQVTEYVTEKAQETYQVAKTVYDTVTEKVPQLVKETYEYVADVPRKIVEKVKVMVPEMYQLAEQTAPLAVGVAFPITKSVYDVLPKQEGSALAGIFNDPKELAEHKEAIPSKDGYEYPAVTMEEFINYSKGKSLETLQSDVRSPNGTRVDVPADSHAPGPNQKYRYVIDPKDPNKVIDMRHFLVVGPQGEKIGLAVEISQLGGDPQSAFQAQDFFSNALGARFFENYNRNQNITDQLTKYFAARNVR